MYLPVTRDGYATVGLSMRSDYSQIVNREVPEWVRTLDAFLLRHYRTNELTPIVGDMYFTSKLDAITPALNRTLCDKRVVTLENPTILDEQHIVERKTVPMVFAGMIAYVDNGVSGGAFLHEMVMWFGRIQDTVTSNFALAMKSSTITPDIMEMAREILLGLPMKEAVGFAPRRCRRIFLAASDPDDTPHGICQTRYMVIKTWMNHFEGRVKEAMKEYGRKKRVSALIDMACMVDNYLPANMTDPHDEDSEISQEIVQDRYHVHENEDATAMSQLRTRQDDEDDTESSASG